MLACVGAGVWLDALGGLCACQAKAGRVVALDNVNKPPGGGLVLHAASYGGVGDKVLHCVVSLAGFFGAQAHGVEGLARGGVCLYQLAAGFQMLGNGPPVGRSACRVVANGGAV